VSVDQGLVGSTADRRAGEMDRWRKRSRRIELYRKTLPWLMLAIVAAVIGWVGLRAILSARQAASTGSAELRMTNPKFSSRDEQGRSFQLTAKEAIRAAGDNNQIALIGPGMTLDAGNGQIMSLTGGGGEYDETEKIVRLDKGVRMQDGKGLDLTSPEAVIDTQAQVVRGEKGVEGRSPLGQVSASSYAIYDGGSRAVFSGGVRSRIVPQD
jgi:lipopolysaccharide export system protein LptC